jgi:ribonuclease P/MRP protein subunit POP1
MENLWGYRLAVYMNEKAFRSTHKASQQIALVHDASYIQRFALRGPWEAVLACLQRVSNTTVLDFAGGRIEVQVNAYSQEGGKIAPIGVLCEPLHGHDTTVWIAVHPAAYAQVVALFQNMAEEGLSVDTILHTNHFKVIGPSSVHFLRAVLQPTTEWTQQHDYSA